MRAKDVTAACPSCGAPARSEDTSPQSEDTSVRAKHHPYVTRWIQEPHGIAREHALYLKDPILPLPDSELRWAHTHRGDIVVYVQLERDRVEFISIRDHAWHERFHR